MKAYILAALAAIAATACTQTTCQMPDPVDPSHTGCWSKGLDCGTGITDPINK